MNKHTYPTPQSVHPPSLFSTVADSAPITISWEEVYRSVSQDERIAINTEAARSLLAAGDTKGYSKQKSLSGAITPAAQCRGGHKAEHLVALTGVSLVDLDHIPPERMEEISAKVRSDPHTMISHITCSGQGLRIFYRYTTPDDAIAYHDAWAWGNQYYSMLTQFDHDKATKDVTRLSFLSHDPDCYFNPCAEPFRIVAAEKDTLDFGTTTDEERIQRAEEILRSQGFSCHEGSRHNYLIQIGRLLYKYGIPQADAQRYAEGVMPDDTADARKAMAWVYEHQEGKFGAWLENFSKHKPKKQKGADASDDEPDRPSGIATPGEIKDYLQSHARLRFNKISATLELWNPKKECYEDINDRLLNSLWQEAIVNLGRYVKPMDFDKVVNSEIVEAYNPFELYFANLPTWDGEDHIAHVAQRVHVVDSRCTMHDAQLPAGSNNREPCSVNRASDQEVFELCFKRWLVGMVSSWLDPKVMNQVILTFIGGQGLYKSTFFRKLMPPELERYFLAKGNSTYVSKDDKLAVSNYGLIDFEEIDSMKDADLNAVKALVTTEVIAERAAYARNRENRAHLASFCATGNNLRFLTDLTGNRRWLPFEIERIDSPYEHPIDYPQLYAQAKHLVDTGYQYWFNREEDAALEEHKSRFAVPCPEEEQLLRYYRKPEKGEVGSFYTATEIAARCNADLRGQITPTKMGQVLAKLKIATKTIRGKRGYILVERTYEEIQMSRVHDVAEIQKAEREAEEMAHRQTTIFDTVNPKPNSDE